MCQKAKIAPDNGFCRLDDEAGILFIKFKHAKIVDNEPLDDKGLVIASLDERGKVVGLVIMEASKFTEECKN